MYILHTAYSCLPLYIFGIGSRFVCFVMLFKYSISSRWMRLFGENPKLHSFCVDSFGRWFVCLFVRLFIWFLYSHSDTHTRSSVWFWRSVHLMCYQYKWTLIHSKGIIIVCSLCSWIASTTSIYRSIIKSISFVGENGRAITILSVSLCLFLFFVFHIELTLRNF